MEKILVTGGCGFIGSHLVEALLKSGKSVIVVDNLSTGKNIIKGAKIYIANVTSYRTIKKIIEKEKPDKIVHLAARARIQPSIKCPLMYHNINVTGSVNIFELARKYNIKKVVYASSSSVMFGNPIIPFKEDSQPKPKTPYSLSKYIDEQYATLYHDLYGLDAVGFRFFNVYGRRMTKGPYRCVMTIFCESVKRNKPLPIVGNGEQKRDFTHVSDIVSGILLGLEKERIGGEVFNLGRSRSLTVNYIADLLAPGYPKKHGMVRIGETEVTLADNSKAKKILNWLPKVNIEDVISEVIEEENMREYINYPLPDKKA